MPNCRYNFLICVYFVKPSFIFHVLGPPHLQGTSKERFPGCVKLGEKVAFCLPTFNTPYSLNLGSIL